MNKLLRNLLLIGLLMGGTVTVRAQSQEAIIQRIRDLQATVQNRKAYLTSLQPGGNYALPIGLLQLGADGDKPSIIIDKIELFSDRAELTAYAVLMLPGSDKPLYFGTTKPVSIGYKGGILETARLSLLQDRTIKLGNDGADFTIKADALGAGGTIEKDATFIEFDCKGFSRASLAVEALLSSKLVKENADGDPIPGERVKASFRLEFASLSDIVADASIEPFQVSGVPGLTFEVSHAVIDLSDISNGSTQFPSGYISTYYPGAENLWKGFSIRKLRVKFPREIEDINAKGSRKVSTEFNARNLLIDNHGFSGEISFENLFSIENGFMDGWSYSINSIGLGFTANQLVSGSMAGGVILPVGGKETPFAYKAAIDQHLNFNLNVVPEDDVKFSILRAAHVKLYPNSTVNVDVVAHKFKARAKLSGIMTIGADLTENENETDAANKASFAGLGFQDLTLSTTSPYIHSGTFDFGAQVTIANYTASISEVGLVREDDLNALRFKLAFNMMNAEDETNGFAISAGLRILSRVNITSDGKQEYKYVKTRLSSIAIKVDQGSFKLDGSIDFFKSEANFGSGFKGNVNISLPMMVKEFGATVLFGKVEGFKYWYTDALVGFTPGIQVFPTVEINGFVGGLYYKVKQKAATGSLGVVNQQTGLMYMPDKDSGLGVKAAVKFGLIGSSSTFNGDLGFEVAFNSVGGLQRVTLMGNAYLMQDPPYDILAGLKTKASSVADSGPLDENSFEVLPSGQGAFAVNVLMQYSRGDAIDGSKSFLSVDLKSKIDAGPLQAVAESRAYFSKSNWFIFIGEMEDSKRVQVSLFDAITANAYFMIGTDVPANLPPIPNLPQTYRPSGAGNVLATGKGFAFGASVGFSIPETRFLIFYGKLDAGAGFDVMLVKQDARCEGRTGTIGFNGWYAQGQIYAYIDFAIGVTARLFKKTRRFEILSASLAAAFKAKLPNPLWMQATLHGQYKVMNGLVKGKFSFQFTKGEECKLVGGSILDANLKIISEVIPRQGDTEVSVFTKPQVVLNMPLGQSFDVLDDDGNKVQFRAIKKHFSVTADGKNIAGVESRGNAVLAFESDEALPGEKEITVSAEIAFQQQNPNGQWEDYMVDGKKYIETVNSTFTTGPRPLRILYDHITYAYPRIDNPGASFHWAPTYYKDETKKGYIMLSKNYGYLFSDPRFKQVGILKASDSTETVVDVSYSNYKINFIFPEISNAANYRFFIRAVPVSTKVLLDENIKAKTEVAFTEVNHDVDADAVVTTQETEGRLESEKVGEIVSSIFYSSKYNTLQDHLNDSEPRIYGQHLTGYMYDVPSAIQEFYNDESINSPCVKVEVEDLMVADKRFPGLALLNTGNEYNYSNGAAFSFQFIPLYMRDWYETTINNFKIYYYQNAHVDPIMYRYPNLQSAEYYGYPTDPCPEYPYGYPFRGWAHAEGWSNNAYNPYGYYNSYWHYAIKPYLDQIRGYIGASFESYVYNARVSVYIKHVLPGTNEVTSSVDASFQGNYYMDTYTGQ